MRIKNARLRQTIRRRGALGRLREQLENDVALVKKNHPHTLSDGEKNRIKKEISILESKIVADEVARAIRTKRKKTRTL